MNKKTTKDNYSIDKIVEIINTEIKGIDLKVDEFDESMDAWMCSYTHPKSHIEESVWINLKDFTAAQVIEQEVKFIKKNWKENYND